MHVGYVGTAFRGLQKSANVPLDATVEGVLERALLHAGYIAPYNYGDLFKIHWTRNSRTDAGVHSLSTVIGFRCQFAGGDADFQQDGEGLAHAAAINAHLPETVKVFSVQRVQKRFSARRACLDRTYEYYLPAHVLGWTGDGGDADKARLSRFRSALAAFEGSHAFHNYTVHRRVSAEARRMKKGVRMPLTRRRHAAAQAALRTLSLLCMCLPTDGAGACCANVAVIAGLQGNRSAENKGQVVTSTAAPLLQDPGTNPVDGEDVPAAVDARRSNAGSGGAVQTSQLQQEPLSATLDASPWPVDAGAHGQDGSTHDDDAALDAGQASKRDMSLNRPVVNDGDTWASQSGSDDDGVPDSSSDEEGQVWVKVCDWVGERPKGDPDRIIQQHFRTIHQWTCQDPCSLVDGGTPCLRLEVTGGSFMLHQIRHMVGAAVAAAHGVLPLALLRASLAPGSRVHTPRAPPHCLLLLDCTFSPFRKVGNDTVDRLSGESLELRAGGAQSRRAFRESVFDAELNELLDHPDWERFREDIPRYVWPRSSQELVVAEHAAWLDAREASAQRRLERQQREPLVASSVDDQGTA